MNELSAPGPLLEVDRVCVGYPSPSGLFRRQVTRQVVRDVSVEVRAGETLGLVGESGSGKTTLGRAILRLVPTEQGHIRFDGADITSWGSHTPLQYRRAVQVIFQDPLGSLNPRLTVGETLSEAIRFHGKASGQAPGAKAVAARVRELLDWVGLASFYAERYPHDMSGGQLQRVAISRALVPEPRLIICDEPVSALDVSTQSQVINLLRDLQSEHGYSYVFISHDLEVVRHISHRIAVMESGSLVEIGAAEDVYLNPTHEYTARLLSSVPRIGAALERAEDRPI